MLQRSIIKLNNFLTRFRRVRVAPGNLLLLLPRCLQWSECPQDVIETVGHCKRCGKCPVKDMAELADKYGVQCAVAGGGRQAARLAKSENVKAIVAVACGKELYEGVRAIFPKPVLTVYNTQPCGFCHNTRVDPAQVEAAIRELIAAD